MIYYSVQTENGKFHANARNWFTVGFVAWWIGIRSYIDLNPQRVIIWKYKVVKNDR